MPSKKLFPLSVNPDRVILAVLLSVALACSLKDGFTSLFFDGKSFAGRGLPIQAALLSALFLAFFALLFFLLPGLLDLLLSNMNLALAALSLVPITAYAWMGSYSRFVSDDFSSAALSAKLGVWGASVDWYMHWTGRFSANLVDSLTGWLGPRALAVQTAIVLALWIISLTLAVRFLLKFRKNSWLPALFLSSLTLNAAFQVAPDLPQSLYWAQGMHSLVLPLALGTFLTAALLHLWRQTGAPRDTAAWAAGAGLLAFIAGGFGETYVSLQTLMLALALVLGPVFFREEFRRKLLPATLASLAGSLLAAVVVVLSPGNAARQAEFPPTPALPAMLWIALQSYGVFLGAAFSSLIKIGQLGGLFAAAFLAGSGFIFGAGGVPREAGSRKTGLYLLTILVGTLALAYACFVPSAFGMSTTPPGRTLVIPSFLLAAGTALAGYFAGDACTNLVWKIKSERPRLVRVLAWALLLVFSAGLFITTRGILSLLPDYSRFARVSDAADAIIRQARAEGLDSVEIPEVHNHFGLSDFGVGTNAWLDDAVNQYYGIRVIINKDLNRRYK